MMAFILEGYRQAYRICYRIREALSCIIARMIFRSSLRMGLVNLIGVLSGVGMLACYILFVAKLFSSDDQFAMLECVLGGYFLGETSTLMHLSSRLSLVMWLLNLPETLTPRERQHTMDCLYRMEKLEERRFFDRWEGVDDLVALAQKRLAG